MTKSLFWGGFPFDHTLTYHRMMARNAPLNSFFLLSLFGSKNPRNPIFTLGFRVDREFGQTKMLSSYMHVSILLPMKSSISLVIKWLYSTIYSPIRRYSSFRHLTHNSSLRSELVNGDSNRQNKKKDEGNLSVAKVTWVDFRWLEWVRRTNGMKRKFPRMHVVHP